MGMCGPIAIALPRVQGVRAISFGTGRLLYNLGRTTTYSALGALFGALGHTLELAGWQQGLSIAVGCVILVYIVTRYTAGGRFPLESVLLRAIAPVQRILARQLRFGAPHGLFVIGLLNGLLPCGLVYVALAGATAAGCWHQGALFMALFGLGTTPLMFAIALAGPRLHQHVRGRLQWLIPLGLFALAILFILRGLNLGIPYISPRLGAMGATEASCCSGPGME